MWQLQICYDGKEHITTKKAVTWKLQHIIRKLQNALNAFEQGRLKQAEILYLECLDKIQDKDTPAYKQALHGLSYVKIEMKQLTEANELYSELLRISQNEGNKEDEAIALHQLGIVHRMDRNYEAARRYLEQEETIYKSIQGNFHLGLAANYYEQGMIDFLMNNFQKAKVFMKKSLGEAKQDADQMVIGYTYRALGDIESKRGNVKEAIRYFEYATSAFEKVDANEAVKEIRDRIVKLK